VVHAREVEGRALTLLVSGKLWRNSLVMQDLETETLWSHITGEALEGELAGTRLEILPSIQTTWSEWKAAYPGSQVLVKSEEVKSSRYSSYFADPERTGLFRARWLQGRLPGKTLVYGLRHGPHAVAVVPEILADGQTHVVELGDQEVIIQRQQDGGVRAWWKGAGRQLDELAVLETFWFAWSGFYPNTMVVD